MNFCLFVRPEAKPAGPESPGKNELERKREKFGVDLLSSFLTFFDIL